MDQLELINTSLQAEGADAWIIVDYENKNKTLVSFLGNKMLTRKIFMVFPANRTPFLICHSIDTVFLKDCAFDLKVYHTWQEMLEIERKEFKDYKKVLMDISENGLLPRISLADYGSVDFIKKLGIEIASSGNILQRFSAVFDEESVILQEEANKKNLQIKDEAFAKIKELIEANGETSEYEIQQFICKRYHEEGMVYDEAPIVAIGKNASDPHYGPTKSVTSLIKKGDLVLIDMWAKMDHPNAVYSDITWMGFVGTEVPNVYQERFTILRKAIELSFEFLENTLPVRAVEGYEVDRVSRDYIESMGYGQFFVHRTGHNIAVDVSPHGPGANIDDYESHDTRELVDGVCFSLEPGIYAPDFGMRSETNVYIKGRKPLYVAGHQIEIVPILK